MKDITYMDINILLLIIPLAFILIYRDKIISSKINIFIALILFKVCACIYFELEFNIISNIYDDYAKENILIFAMSGLGVIILLFNSKLKLKITSIFIIISILITLLTISGIKIEFISNYIQGFYFILTMIGSLGLKKNEK